jgi:UDP-glucose 4-epimerase
MKTILITGAAGFLGSHLTDFLLQSGHAVIGVDNLSHGTLRNLKQASMSPNFQFFQADVLDLDDVRECVQNVDAIAHLAAFKIPRYGRATETPLINSMGTHNMLRLACERKIKILLTSTSDVYGKNPVLPFKEDSNSVLGPSALPRWGYAISKLFDEHLAFAISQECNFPAAIVRLFGSYGPRQHLSWWGGPQSIFIDAILRGHPVPIHGDGLQTRTFNYVSDTIAGIAAALEHPEANGQVVNIGNIHETTIIELAQTIQRLIYPDRELNVQYVPYDQLSTPRYEDVEKCVPDICKAQTLFGFVPKIDLEVGLAETIAWQRQFINP